MKFKVSAAIAVASLVASPALAQFSSTPARPYDSMIASHAAANGVPVELVHRVIVRESRYRAEAMGRGGTVGLMQIKLATARGVGYTGTAAGLRDPDTNLMYGVRYLAGAYRAAGGNPGRAVGYYASGYYGAAKRQRIVPAGSFAQAAPEPSLAAPQPSFFGSPDAITLFEQPRPVRYKSLRKYRRR